MVIHFHHAIVPNSGELKRMKNIDRDIVPVLGGESVEVEFYGLKKYRYVHSAGQFRLSDNVVRKYYIPEVGKLRFFNSLYKTFVLLFLSCKYKADYIIGEMFIFRFIGSYLKFFNKKCRLVFDIHGAAAEEIKYQHGDRETSESIKNRAIECNGLKMADIIICQSDEMKEYINRAYGIDKRKVCVYRCGVDTNLFHVNDEARKRIRSQYEIQDGTVVFVYSGGLHPWQRIDESIDLFEKYHSFNSNSKFMVLTGDGEGLYKKLGDKNIRDVGSKYIVISLPFEQVPDYLNAADIAFLLRHNHVMNAVASPTKLAEYMACGLPVITSAVAEKWVQKEGMRYFVIEDYVSDMVDIDAMIETSDRNEISSFAQRTLSLDVDRKNVASFFNEFGKGIC